jgi:hypothetical protein
LSRLTPKGEDQKQIKHYMQTALEIKSESPGSGPGGFWARVFAL